MTFIQPVVTSNINTKKEKNNFHISPIHSLYRYTVEKNIPVNFFSEDNFMKLSCVENS